MGTWTSIATGTTCLIVTIAGLLLSFIAWRKKGIRSGLRGVAWSLLPIAMYLTHAIGLVGRIGSAIVVFGTNFVFSPNAWLGVVLVAIAVLLFLITGSIPLLTGWGRRKRDTTQSGQKTPRDAGGHVTQATTPAQQGQTRSSDDDLGDVEEILRRHGIK